MNSISVLLFCCFVFLSGSICIGGLVNSSLIKPKATDVLKQPERSSFQLNLLIQENKNDKFYLKADEVLKKIKLRSEEMESLSEEEKSDAMWTFYMISNTPLLLCQSYQDAKNEVVSSGRDIQVKQYLMGMLMHPWFDKFFPKEKQIKGIRISYASTILKEMRALGRGLPDPELIPYNTIQAEKDLMASYSARIEKNRKKEKSSALVKFDLEEWKYAEAHPEDKSALDRVHEKSRLLKQQNDQANAYGDEAWNEVMRQRSFLLFKSNRDMQIGRALAEMEKDFMVMLVRFYPEKASEVKKLLKEAGYSNQEIYDLIDRTVGRTAKTQFLYKGANRKRAL